MDLAKRYSLFVDQYKDCTLCRLHECRKVVVIGRGDIPATVAFVGEAPGYSEDSQGLPFVGPAGHLLDQIISEAGATDIPKVFTNVVCCLPADKDGTKLEEPADESVLACRNRLVEFIDMADPRLIVAVGRFSFNWLDPTASRSTGFKRPVPVVDITHPAAILRGPEAAKGLTFRRCVATIQDAMRDYL